MAEKPALPNKKTVEAVRLYFVVTRPTFNAVDEHVGICAILHDTIENGTSTVIKKTANYMGLNEWSMELFVPPYSTLEYNACLYRPSRSKVSDFGDTRGLYKPPLVASFKNHPWLEPSESKSSKEQTQENLANIFHNEACDVRKLVVEEKSLRIDIVYDKDEAKITEIRSHLTSSGSPLNIGVQLPKDRGFYNPDIRHFIDKDYNDNLLPESALYSVKLGAAYDTITHTIIGPDKPFDDDVFEEVTSDTPFIEAGESLLEPIDTPPTSRFPSSSSLWNIAKYGLPVLGIGLAAALYYKYK